MTGPRENTDVHSHSQRGGYTRVERQLSPGGTHDGQPYFQLDSSHYLFYNSAAGGWALKGALLDAGGGAFAYTQASGAASPNTADGAWAAVFGSAPAPTVTGYGPSDATPPVPLSAGINSAGTTGTLNWTEADSPPVLQAAGMGATQGLTLTASGGPVAVSAVTTAGTVTSFTTSRTVALWETLTLAGLAACFTDSASTPNAAAAFSGLAVANGSTVDLPDRPAFAAVFQAQIVVVTSRLPSGAASLNLQRAPDAAGSPGAWATPADGVGVTPSSVAVDTGLTPGTTYHYRFAAVAAGGTLTYGPESGPVTTGAIPMSLQTAPDPSYTPSGILSKVGIAIEGTPGNAVKAARLLDRVVGNLTQQNSRLASKATHNHPGRVRSVLGTSKTDGQVTVEATPETLDELLCLICGAPTNAAASTASTAQNPAGVPQAPTGLVVLQGGTAGAATVVYTAIARNMQGDSVASATVTTNTANAALSPTNYNQIQCGPVLTAMQYVWLKAGQVVGISDVPWFNDIGQVTSAYAAPSAAAGYVNTYKLGNTRLTASLQENRAGSIFLYGGVSANKLSFKYDKKQGDPFNLVADLVALSETLGWTEAQLGLDTAGTDPLGNFSVAAGCKTYIAGGVADAESWSAEVDNNLGEKHALKGYTGPAGHFKQGSNHGLSVTLYFSSEAEYQRYMGYLPGSVTGPYGASKTIQLFPVALFLYTPVNSAGVVNEFRILLPSCEIDASGPKYPGKDGAVMMDVTLYPCIDNTTGTDVIFQTVSSRTGVGTQTTSLVTGSPANAVYPYVS